MEKDFNFVSSVFLFCLLAQEQSHRPFAAHVAYAAQDMILEVQIMVSRFADCFHPWTNGGGTMEKIKADVQLSSILPMNPL